MNFGVNLWMQQMVNWDSQPAIGGFSLVLGSQSPTGGFPLGTEGWQSSIEGFSLLTLGSQSPTGGFPLGTEGWQPLIGCFSLVTLGSQSAIGGFPLGTEGS